MIRCGYPAGNGDGGGGGHYNGHSPPPPYSPRAPRQQGERSSSRKYNSKYNKEDDDDDEDDDDYDFIPHIHLTAPANAASNRARHHDQQPSRHRYSSGVKLPPGFRPRVGPQGQLYLSPGERECVSGREGVPFPGILHCTADSQFRN